MVGDCALSVPILLNSLGNFSLSLTLVVQYTPVEYFFKCRSIGISLALGYLRDIFVSIEVINEAVNKIIFSEDGLALNLIPDGPLANSPFDKLLIFFLCLRSCSAELSEYPVRGEAGVGRFFPCCGPVAGPSPVFGVFDHLGAYGVKNHVSAYFKEVCVLLDEDGFVPALKEVPGLVVAFVFRACV
jgi:hypothetical protein